MAQRLKKLELLGFKSFADKTSLTFSPGITGVVGPNGCGKSNIADAFRWVLGEQSAKSMRGAKMPDVIFSGTSNRSPLNFAEVTITLCNEDGQLPVKYNEVAITRRLHRSGESEYLLNRHAVRLKDLQDLFLDAGVGKNAFAIFEQGKIDQVIQYSPLERRYIFEDAAGILRFLQRKRDALKKLEQVDQNISRAKDIHQEVEKQIALLEAQAAKARIYKENKTRFDLLEKHLFVLKWDNLQQRHSETTNKEGDHRQHLAQATNFLEKWQTQLQEAKALLEKNEKALRQKNEELFATRSKKEIKTRERQSQAERLKETNLKEKRWQQELESLTIKRQARQTERKTAQQQYQQLEKLVNEYGTALQTQREQNRILEEAVSALREKHQVSQQERIKLVQRENQCDSELKQNAIRQETLHERREALQVQKKKAISQIEESQTLAQKKKQELDAGNQAIDTQKKQLIQFNEQFQNITKDLQTTRKSLDTLQQETAETKARQKVLTRLRDEKEGFSTGSKRLLQESTNVKSPLNGLLKGLYEFIIPQSGSETALADALRPYSQTLVVQTQTDLEKVLEYAHAQKLKDFSLICLENLPKHSSEAVADSLLHHVVDHVLSRHFLRNVCIVSADQNVKTSLQSHPQQLVWSPNGYFLDHHRVLFYATQSENNVFLREAELKALEKKIETLESDRQILEATLKHGYQQRDRVDADRINLDKTIRRDEMKVMEVNFHVQRLNSDVEKARQEEKQLTQDTQNIDANLAKIATALTELTQQHQEVKTAAAAILKKCDEYQHGFDTEMARLKQERDRLQEKETAYRKASDDHKKLQHQLHILEVQDGESDQQERRLHEEIKHSSELQAQLQSQGSQVDQNLQEVEQLLEKTSSENSQLEQEVQKSKTAIETCDGKIQEARGRLTKAEEERHRTDLQKTQLQSSLMTIANDLQERYQLQIDEVRGQLSHEEKLPPSMEQAERQLRSLRSDIENAGDINMTSIEECDKNKTRHEFLMQQIGDLDGSKKELIEIITELDTESRKLFKDTFNQVCANFKKNFKILFNGGEADLQFTEAADILEAGIEIIAKPPGKQMRSISLMSGGEKCLTAMALLFAIFEVKPAPFCILDEIDAPLDDSNVERFVNVVKQFIDRCQFIIITHNKRTMTIADVLCGVSMQERGVSKLLTMELAQHANAKV
ncbi:MAG: chromosome segregation protein SMC [Parachlamydiaceae bacterium]|nr:chromosome segregation protein SMC [Parachlamydiaceae bacterium]